MAKKKLPIIERLETFWEQHNSKLNAIIGKATVPAMRSGDPLAKEVHSDLLDFAHWVDEQFEGMDEA